MTTAPSRQARNQPRPLAVTMGEPAGIGTELVLKSWLRRAEGALPPFLLLADPSAVAEEAKRLKLRIGLETVATPAEAGACFARALPILSCPLAVPAEPGRPDPANAGAVTASIEQAVTLARSGAVGAVVTNPIQKSALYKAGFPYPGHTEFLAALAGLTTAPVMLLACPALRVVPVTVHVSLREAIAQLTSEGICHAAEVTAAALERDFAIARPRLAVAGLNPHAGEEGALGREEIEVIAPAIARLRAAGHEVSGPHPADTLFHAAARKGYDAALCMYHDQALIPLKTLDFERGVNVTLGLPFVRTSPDHGTALAIAGKGLADPASFIAALRLAQEMAAARARASEASLA